MKKKGISAIVATVLIILITVVAISVVWLFILPMINNSDVSLLGNEVSIITSEGYTVYDAEDGLASVQVGRSSDQVDVSKVKIIFEIEGRSYCSVVDAPGVNEKQTYYFDVSIADDSGLGVVGVAPVVVVNGRGIEGDVVSEVELVDGDLDSNVDVYSVSQEACSGLITTFMSGICKAEELMSAEEKSVLALLKYSESEELCFEDLFGITDHQKTKVDESIDMLEGSNFVVVGTDVVVLSENCGFSFEEEMGEELIGDWEYKDDNWDIYSRNYSPESGTYVDEWLVAWFCGGDYCDDELEYDSLEIVPGKTYLVEYDIIGFGGLGLNNHGTRAEPFFSVEIGGVSGIRAEHFGRYSESITAETSESLKLKAVGQAAIHIDRISVREVPTVEPCVEGKVEVYMEGDLVMMEIVDVDGMGRERFLLRDLNGFSDQEDCSVYDSNGESENVFRYIICYVENFAKVNSNSLIGEDEGLITYVENYLENHVDNFYSRFELEVYDDIIEVISNDAAKDYGLYLRIPEGQYDRSVAISELEDYEEFLLDTDEPSIFSVIENGVPSEISVFSTNGIINTLNEVADKDDDAFKCGESSCDYNLGSSGIPCNNKIDLFLGFSEEEGFGSNNDVIANFKRLEKLGYNVNPTEFDNDVSREGSEMINSFLNSQAQQIFTSFHGLKSGHMGPLECVENDDSSKDKRKKELLDMNCGLSGEGDISFILSSQCRPGHIALFINVKSLSGTRAVHSGVQCYGLLNGVNSFSSVLRTGLDVSYPPYDDRDIDLLVNYFLGQGPELKHYQKYPVIIGDDINVDTKYNFNVGAYNNLGGPLFPYTGPRKCRFCPAASSAINCASVGDFCTWEPESSNGFCISDPEKCRGYLDFREYRMNSEDKPFCYNKVTLEGPFRVPCLLSDVPDSSGVHLYPYINMFLFNRVLPRKLDITFSDEVSQPLLVMMLINGQNVLEDGGSPFYASSFVYNVFSEVEIIDSLRWNAFSSIEKELVRKGETIVNLAYSTIPENRVKMIGNPLASITGKNKSHKIDFFLYDNYFWEYNGRSTGGDNSFKAKVPYILHPYVTSANQRSIYFSHPIQGEIDSNALAVLEVTGGEGCYNIDGDSIYSRKPYFSNGDLFSGAGSIKFGIRGDIGFFEGANIRNWGDWTDKQLMDSYGYDKSNWPEKYAVTVKVSGVKSNPHDFDLQGNFGSSWSYDWDGRCTYPGGEVYAKTGNENINGYPQGVECTDWKERNSDRLLQTKGDFIIKIPCIPKWSACLIEEKDEYGVAYRKTCNNELNEKRCKDAGGEFKDNYVCLDHVPGVDAIGEKKVNGDVQLLNSHNENFKMKVETTFSGCPNTEAYANTADSFGAMEGATSSKTFKLVGNLGYFYYGTELDCNGKSYATYLKSYYDSHSLADIYYPDFSNEKCYDVSGTASISLSPGGSSIMSVVSFGGHYDCVMTKKSEKVKCGEKEWYYEAKDVCCKYNQKQGLNGCVEMFV